MPQDEIIRHKVTFYPQEASVFNDGKFEGWGTSFCWWANRLGYSNQLTEEAARLFYGDEGLRLNIVRYNIGGGDDPAHTHITRTDSEIPGYAVNIHINPENGKYQWEYDWDADINQMNVVKKAIEVCEDGIIVEAFSNSPPYFMTNSGCSAGALDAYEDNLKKDYYNEFAVYLADIVDYWYQHGIKFQSIAPMNEPYTDYWRAYHWKQEGCHFDQGKSQSQIIVSLKKELMKRNLNNIIISGTDETSIDVQIDSYYSLSNEAKNVISRIDTHSYKGEKRTSLRELAEREGKNLWMSEVDDGAIAGENSDEMGAALWLAQRIIKDMNELKPSAWILWQIIDSHICSDGYRGKKDYGMVDVKNGYWGTAVADHDQQKILLTMKYYGMGQFTRYIRPGYTIIPGDETSLAAYDSESKNIVIVAVNQKEKPVEKQFVLSYFEDVGSLAEVYRTSGTIENGEKWEKLDDITVISKDSVNSLVTILKENSITTFVVKNG